MLFFRSRSSPWSRTPENPWNHVEGTHGSKKKTEMSVAQCEHTGTKTELWGNRKHSRQQFSIVDWTDHGWLTFPASSMHQPHTWLWPLWWFWSTMSLCRTWDLTTGWPSTEHTNMELGHTHTQTHRERERENLKQTEEKWQTREDERLCRPWVCGAKVDFDDVCSDWSVTVVFAEQCNYLASQAVSPCILKMLDWPPVFLKKDQKLWRESSLGPWGPILTTSWC